MYKLPDGKEKVGIWKDGKHIKWLKENEEENENNNN